MTIALIVIAVLLVLLIGAVALQLPEIRRYLKIRAM
ncbi:MAG: DUF6893 family small protein [Thermoleophilaceae bacterium]|jgi:hypothetical protein